MSTVGSAYKKETFDENYDVIVIGSGIGGLATAAFLAKEGKKVLVLERHYTAGGYTHTFTRKGYEWDVGVHYIGEVHRKNSILRKILDDVSENRLEWAQMDDVYDRAIIAGDSYDFVSGVQRFKQKMIDYFPKEEKAIEQYIQKVFAVNKATRGFFAGKALPPFLGKIASPLLNKRFFDYSDKTVKEVLSQLTNDPKLIGVLSSQWGDYGLPPEQASFAIHAMVVRHYFEGGSYPVGGSASIASSIAPTIEKAGGKILLRADVKEIIVRNGHAIGVKMADDREIHAKKIVSNAGIYNTFVKMLPPTLSQSQKIVQKLSPSFRHSAAHLCLYIGLNHSAEELGLKTTNLWIYPDYDHDNNIKSYLDHSTQEFPAVYISFPSVKDPDWDKRYPGKSTIEIVSFAPYEWFEKWKETRWYKRGDEYLNYKEELSQRLLEKLYQQVPSVKGKIDTYELSTPLSTQHFSNYERGEIYGLDHTPERFRQQWLRPHTPIKNLFLTGQDVSTAGVTGALFGGLLTASAMMRKNVILDVIKRTT